MCGVPGKKKKNLLTRTDLRDNFFSAVGCRSIGRTADSGSANQGSSPCSPANALFLRPHRLAGPGQRPFTPSTGVQIPLGTPKKSSPCEKSRGLFVVEHGVREFLWAEIREKQITGRETYSDAGFWPEICPRRTARQGPHRAIKKKPRCEYCPGKNQFLRGGYQSRLAQSL